MIRRELLFLTLLVLLFHTSAVSTVAQGGTGKETPKPPKTSGGATKTSANRQPPVVNLAGTTWGIEGREGAKILGKGVFEFLASGQLRTNGELQQNTVWKQTGRKVVITFADGRSKSVMNGIISANQINGTIVGTDADGASHQGQFSAKRADKGLLAELAYWNGIKGSSNAEDFKTYLQKYPYGAFVEDAVFRMRALETEKSASPSPTPLIR